MKLVQSFWSEPLQNNSHQEITKSRATGGWLNEKIMFMSWALSSLLLKRTYPNLKLELVTDDYGKQMLVERFKLPYDTVLLDLNTLHAIPKGLWAYGKIVTYSIQDEPFLHIDGDVFIWKKVLNPFFSKKLICQSFEETNQAYYGIIVKEILKNFKLDSELKNYIKNQKNWCGVNAGVMGGNDYYFFKEYTKYVLELLKGNMHLMNKINIDLANNFYEQLIFLFMAKKEKLNIDFLITEVSEDFNELIDMANIYDLGYNHIVGFAKKHPIINEQVYFRLKMLFPSCFNRIQKFYE